MKDLTRQFDYERLVREERAHFSQIQVTDDLREGGVQGATAWQLYWDRLRPLIQGSGFASLGAHLSRELSDLERPIEVLSLGSGYCGHELAMARTFTRPYRIECTDLNDGLFEQAKSVAAAEGLSIEFRSADINFLSLDPRRYDLIFAHAVIHHVINLEHLFEQLVAGLAPGGLFHLVDVVGMNRKLIWDENEQFANALLERVPDQFTGGRRLAVPAGEDGMEGIRQAEILGQLRESFKPIFEHRHGAFMRFVCTHPELGPALGAPEARRFFEFLADCDDASVRHGLLRPLEIWGVYRVAGAG